MGTPIRKMNLKGYKSIRLLEDFELTDVNVLIGANGCGKSNFVSFFHFLRELVEGRLEKAVNKAGGADKQLYLGPKVTEKIEASLEFGANGYAFTLEPTADNRLIFDDERILYYADPGMRTTSVDKSIGVGHSESKLKDHAKGGFSHAIAEYVYDAVSSWTVYHVHDTSETAMMRRPCSVDDTERLRPHAENLGAFLNWLYTEEKKTYRLIVAAIKQVAPVFKEFKFRPKKQKDGPVIQLDWLQEGSDYTFHPSQLSDGTIRFIALATALLQPYPPATVLIDEPELGLHPFALEILAGLVKSARARCQLILATQSAAFLDYFEPENVVVVKSGANGSEFHRLDAANLESWREKYSLGEIWEKNVVGGGPYG
ncbi:MAG TPA: AAA family ATPase [Gemmataceae bacterium]|nr:AAA family ATPase [Pirellulales bacterium]HZZ79429.1 AAA family ATPase [Gemmataceae bacterium]